MIDRNAAQVGTNLAISLLDKKLELTPIHGSLLSELARSVMTAVNNKPMALSEIEHVVINASTGSTGINRFEQKTYHPSTHDTLTDNYVVDLSNLVASHISFARSVVYKKMVMFSDTVNKFMSGIKVRQAEDFFNVKFYRLHDVFKTQFLADELSIELVHRYSPEILNFGDALNDEYDLVGALMTGESDLDELVKNWFATEGKEKLFSYIKNNLPEYSLSLEERLNYYLINFLFYRNLVIKQDLTNGMSLLQLVSKATVCRDYHLDQLRVALNLYASKLRGGDIIAPESDVKFSHLSEREFAITLFADSFDKAAEQGATIEAVFGYIAKYGKTDLTISSLVANKEEYEKAWHNARGLYASYLMKNKEFIRIELKRALVETLDIDVTEDEKAFELSNKGYREETLALANARIDQMTVAELEDIPKLAFELVARIAYRYTKAASIIGDMLEIQSVNPSIDMKEAAQTAAVNYITDFLMEQCNVTQL